MVKFSQPAIILAGIISLWFLVQLNIASAGTGSLQDSNRPTAWRTPVRLLLSKDQIHLFVANHDRSTVQRVSLETQLPDLEVSVGRGPVDLAMGLEANEIYVACYDDGVIDVLSTPDLKKLRRLAVDPFPVAIILKKSIDGEDRLFSSHAYLDILRRWIPSSGDSDGFLPMGRRSGSILSGSESSSMLVVSWFSTPLDPLGPPAPEVCLVEPTPLMRANRISLSGANILRRGAISRDGHLAIIPVQRPKNLLPGFTVAGGWVMNHGLAILRYDSDRLEAQQVTLDDVMKSQPDPYDIELDEVGRRVYVAIHGANRILVLDLDRLLDTLSPAFEKPGSVLAERLDVVSHCLIKSIDVDAGPADMAMSSSGDRLYVACSFDDAINVINTTSMVVSKRLPLSPTADDSAVRRGQNIFNDARYSYRETVSCNSCHPEGHLDGLAYDLAIDGLGKNRVDVRTLLGAAGTEPFKWIGTNSGFYAQCGPRAAMIIMRSRGFTPPQLDDLVAYLQELRLPSNPYSSDPAGAESRERGRKIFFRSTDTSGRPIPHEGQCGFCHPDGRFSNFKAFDVGTATESDLIPKFDTPQLENLFMTAPYLHDGSAATLEQCFTTKNPNDAHGIANDLGKDDLNDLVEFMRSIGPGEIESRPGQTGSLEGQK